MKQRDELGFARWTCVDLWSRAEPLMHSFLCFATREVKHDQRA